MAKAKGEYVPDEETMVALRRVLSGSGSAEEANYVNALFRRDPNFAAFVRKYRTSQRGVGVAGARRSGGQGSASRYTLGGGISLPGLNQNLQQRSYYGRTTSPGGFKKSGYDLDSDIRRSGDRTSEAVLSTMKRTTGRNGREDGGIELNGRKYSKRDVEWINSRALTGATLSPDQQAIYDFGVHERRKAAEDEAGRRAKLEADEARRKADEADLAKRNRDLFDWKFKLDAKRESAQKEYERRKRFEAEQKKAAEDEKAEEYNRRHGLAEGTRLSQKDYDDLEAGRKRYGYSKKDQTEIDQIRADLDEKRRSLAFSEDEWDQIEKEAEDRIGRYRKRLVDIPREERTARDIINEAAQNGGYYIDPTGKMVYLRDEDAERAAKVEDRDIANRQRIAIAAENARIAALKAHEVAQAKARKDWETATNEDGAPLHGKDDPFVPTEFDPNFSQNYVRNVQGNMALIGGEGVSPKAQGAAFSANPAQQTYTCPNCGAPMDSADGPCQVCGWPGANNTQQADATGQVQQDDGDWTSGFGGIDPRTEE